MIRDTFDMFEEPDRGRFGERELATSQPRVTGTSDLHDLTVAIHHRTERAVLVSIDGLERRAVWLPLSLIEIVMKNSMLPGARKNGQAVQLSCAEITVPDRLAKEKGLI